MSDEKSEPDFERRARLSIVWQDLVNPVRAIVDYQEIIVEEAERLRLSDCRPDLDQIVHPARNQRGVCGHTKASALSASALVVSTGPTGTAPTSIRTTAHSHTSMVITSKT